MSERKQEEWAKCKVCGQMHRATKWSWDGTPLTLIGCPELSSRDAYLFSGSYIVKVEGLES